MFKVSLGALVAFVLLTGPAQAGVTFDFTFKTDPAYDSLGVLTGSFEVTIPDFPANNASYSGKQISCSLASFGSLVSCSSITLYTDTSTLTASGDIYDGVSIDFPAGGSAFFYFVNGAFSSTGSYNNIPMTVDNLALVISGTANGAQGVPEPQTWAMMLIGLFGTGMVLREVHGRRRIVSMRFRPT